MKFGHKNISNKAIYGAVSKATGMGYRDVKDAMRGVFHFLSEELAAGRPVNLWGFGSFTLRVRKGRTMSWTNHPKFGTRTSVQPDRKIVKFKPSAIIKAKLNPKPTKNIE